MNMLDLLAWSSLGLTILGSILSITGLIISIKTINTYITYKRDKQLEQNIKDTYVTCYGTLFSDSDPPIKLSYEDTVLYHKASSEQEKEKILKKYL